MKNIEVVAAIIIKDYHVFAAQRGYGKYKDWWEFPGGKIAKGETPIEALVREIKEELGIFINVGRLIRTIVYKDTDQQIIMYCYEAHLKEGEPILLEHSAARWLDKDNINAIKWMPADLLILDDLKKMLWGEK